MQALREWSNRTQRMRDEEGRPLGESKAPLELRFGVPLELRTCPYGDSRHNHVRPMNVSALKQILAHWEEACSGIVLLRSLYCASAQRDRLRLIDVWRIARLTASLADFAFLRAWAPVGDGCLPAPVAALYKAALGIGYTAGSMWTDGAARFDAPIDAEALYTYADRHQHFVGAREVCAGPVALVKEFLRLMIEGNGLPGDASPVAAVIGDSRRFLQLAHATAALGLLALALDRLDAALGIDLALALADDPAGPGLPAGVREKLQRVRYLGLDAGARPEALDELFTHAADPHLTAAEVGPHIQALRQTCSRPLEDTAASMLPIVSASPACRPLRPSTQLALGRHLARFAAVEHGFARLICTFKEHIADALGVERSGPQAHDLHLVGYVPSGICLTRTILADQLAIKVCIKNGQLSFICSGQVCEAPA